MSITVYHIVGGMSRLAGKGNAITMRFTDAISKSPTWQPFIECPATNVACNPKKGLRRRLTISMHYWILCMLTYTELELHVCYTLHLQVKEFIGSPFADPRKVHAGLAKNNKFRVWIDTERLRTTNQNDESLGMVSALTTARRETQWLRAIQMSRNQEFLVRFDCARAS